MEKNSISKRIDNKHDKTNKIPQSDYKNDERSTEKAHKHVEVYKEESGKSVKLENLFKERSDNIPYTENLKKPSRSLKLKQRKLIRTPDIFITDKIFETKSNSMLLLTTQTLPQSTMSSSFSQHMAIASDISLTNFKKNYVEKAQTEELLTSKNNTNDLIFDYSYDKSTTTSTTKPTVPLKTQITSKALDGKSFTSNQVNSTLSDSVNRITPIVKCSNVLLNVDNNQSDTVSAFSEATSNISSSDLGSGNFNSITGTISTGTYYSDDHEFSILSNLNIDSEISDITIHSSSQNGHQQPQYYQQQPSHSIHHELVSTSTAQYNNSQKQLVTITSSQNAETNAAAKDKSGFVYNNDDNSSPMHLADYDDPLGSDLSTSASTKVTSTNTSFSGESFTGGSIEAPSSPVQRYQNFVFKSNDSIKSFETQTSPQLPIPPPVPRRSFQMQFEKVKSFETTVPSPIAQCTTPLNLPRNQSPDKNLPAHGNICRKTSPNNPFLPEIFKNRYATDRELDENVLFSNAFKEGFQSSEKSNVVDDSKLNESSTFPNVLSTLLTHENTMSKLTGSQSCHCKLENNLISSSNEYKTMITLCNSPVENKNLYAKEASYNTKSTKSYSNMSTKFSPQSKSKRNLNPFSKHCHESLPVSKNLNLKREEFLKATMRICLVVSPPSAKLHVKSKSLSHLDTLTYQVDSKPGNIISTDQSV
ncbi:uncharacterized protein LOC129617024, partial [Condylostylus longicornis]|uniref:uncharacterized protein LOC129617024 n=1 Tax=Condylostylus longicornis TaxID=2530218 RepID=UPI00244DA826